MLNSGQREAQLQTWEGEGGRAALTRPVRILIVDNDMRGADSLELMLHASGYSDTRVAYSAHAALAIAAQLAPDVVLLDLGLLDMTGYELAQSLREHAQSRHVRLIALTSSREHAAREQARAAGFERYLLKPIASLDLAELMATPFQQTAPRDLRKPQHD
jgi:CheY-like chemotaxis protein